MTTVFVPGTPAPQGSTKAFVIDGHAKITHDNKKTVPWRSAIQAEVLREKGRFRIEFPDKEPVELEMEFVMPRRSSEPKRRTPAHTRKPDGDKLARSVGDALAGVIYRDDAQVTRMTWCKRTAEIGEMPGLHLSWRPAGEDEVTSEPLLSGAARS